MKHVSKLGREVLVTAYLVGLLAVKAYRWRRAKR